MWIKVENDADISTLMDTVDYFHDSCLKEMKYSSGAYVDHELYMNPINELRVLSIVFQRQSHKNSVVVLEFRKLKYVKLFPLSENYTCEILDATLLYDSGVFYWCDCGGLSRSDMDMHRGVVICAEELYWKSTDNFLGRCDYFQEHT